MNTIEFIGKAQRFMPEGLSKEGMTALRAEVDVEDAESDDKLSGMYSFLAAAAGVDIIIEVGAELFPDGPPENVTDWSTIYITATERAVAEDGLPGNDEPL